MPKLKIGRPDNRRENKVDRVADTVVRMPDPRPQMQPLEEEEEEKVQMQPELGSPIQMKPEVPQIQRMCPRCKERARQGQPLDCPECEQKLQMSPVIQQGSKGHSYASPEITSQLQTSKGQGPPLPAGVQQEMSHKIGMDFSSVHVHTDSKSHQLNRQLGAKAFTHGKDIYFNKGEYKPDSSSGKHLLAHELTHVVQQGYSDISEDIQCQESKNKQKDNSSTSMELEVDFNAFIPSELGEWVSEPGIPGSSLTITNCQFKTDNRGFAEEGTSRIYKRGYASILQTGIKSVSTMGGSNASHRRCRQYPLPAGYREMESTENNTDSSPKDAGSKNLHRHSYNKTSAGWWGPQETKKASKGGTESVSHKECIIKFKFDGNAAYPFIPIAPTIDFLMNVTISIRNTGIEVSFDGNHDQFPAYEGLIKINGVKYLIYKYMPTDVGPSLSNLAFDEMISVNDKKMIFGVTPLPAICTA